MAGFPDPVGHREVHRSTTAGFSPELSGGADLLDGSAATSDYTDATAASGTTYYYRVDAVTASGVGGLAPSKSPRLVSVP